MDQRDDSLTDLMSMAWRARLAIIAGAATGALIAFILMKVVTPVYEARMIIAPLGQASEETSMAVLSSSPASSREISVSSQLPRDYIKFEQTFREASVAEILFKYAGVVQKIEEDRFFRFTERGITAPEELSDYLREKIAIRQLGATASQLVTYRHPDPVFARKLLQHTHKIADELIRNATRSETETRVAYLQKASRDAYNPEHRKALTDLLLLEERQKMLITMDHPYAADIVEPPAVSAKPVSPKATLIFPVCILAGAAFGLIGFAVRQKSAI